MVFFFKLGFAPTISGSVVYWFPNLAISTAYQL